MREPPIKPFLKLARKIYNTRWNGVVYTMQKERPPQAIDSFSWITTRVLIALLMSTAITMHAGAHETCEIFNKNAKLRLSDHRFNISVGSSPAERWYTFNLTNGTLHTVNAEAKHASCVGGGKKYYISVVGWYANYTGTVTNMSGWFDHFNVTVTLDQYTSPPNPAEITVSLRDEGSLPGANVTHVTDFTLSVSVKPPFTELKAFPNNSDAKDVQEKFESNLWDQTKPDITIVLKENYTASVMRT
ncbi:uncharacterized protein LOC119182337 isoform X2 [Rhipicephalus microplus]|uniref:uncharacterized protein LOC119182337 isoform X2 n=2 Tax=Rhipicephalus microplus TaxID=6941 RepID=UPI003F6AEA2B